MRHARDANELLEIASDELRAIVRDDARLRFRVLFLGVFENYFDIRFPWLSGNARLLDARDGLNVLAEFELLGRSSDPECNKIVQLLDKPGKRFHRVTLGKPYEATITRNGDKAASVATGALSRAERLQITKLG